RPWGQTTETGGVDGAVHTVMVGGPCGGRLEGSVAGVYTGSTLDTSCAHDPHIPLSQYVCGKWLTMWSRATIPEEMIMEKTKHTVYYYTLVVFQKWRWTEINVTLGLIFVASHRKEWPMTFIAVRCPHCQSDQIVKRGKTARGTQRYLCQNTLCPKGSFLLDYCNRGCLPEVKQTIIDMSLNASGVRDTARSLHICPNTVLRELKKKEAVLESVNTALLRTLNPDEVAWDLERAGEAEAEMDEMWSFVRHKGNP